MTRLAAFLAAMLFAFLPARAADTYETVPGTEGEPPQAVVTFIETDCEEECYGGTLHCTGARSIDFTFADVPSADVAAALTSETQDIAVKAGGEAFSFSIQDIRSVELTAAWNVKGRLFTDAAALAAAFGKSATFEASIGSQRLTLPVTADVKSWAEDCLR